MRLPGGLRWWELVPEAMLGIGLTLFFVTETSAASSAFKSTTAIALMAVVAAGWLAARVALLRVRRGRPVQLVLFGAAAVAILAVVVLPAYDDTTVVETLAAPAPTTTSPPATAAPDGPTTTAAPPTTTAAPEVVRSARFAGIDHRAEGTVTIYRQPDGSQVVGLEEIDIQPGPDYDVYVVPGPDQEGIGGGTRLDDLRGNKGTQYYDVPAAVDLTDGSWTVLVWCETFDVPVAGATPT